MFRIQHLSKSKHIEKHQCDWPLTQPEKQQPRFGKTALSVAMLALSTSVSAEELILKSIAQHDGIVNESPALNNTGGFTQPNRSGLAALSIGDLSDTRQVKTIVSFDTSQIPVGAEITEAVLLMRHARSPGASPFDVLAPCVIDVNSGGFNGNVALESEDFDAPATSTAAGTLSAVVRSNEWSQATFSSAGLGAINRSGYTQVRAYCTVEDNGDSSQNTANFASGETPQYAPELVISYTEEVIEVPHSIARIWNEELLSSIRLDFARPTVHARNLYHTSAAMWDAWAAYDEEAGQVIHHEKMAPVADIDAARAEAISYAMYRILTWRFAPSPGAAERLPAFDARMAELGYDTDYTSTEGDSPAALGNRIAASVIEFGLNDYSNEQANFANNYYTSINPPLLPEFPGNPDLVDPDRWQPLSLEFFVDQSGNLIPGGSLDFLSPEWGHVSPFALTEDDLTVYSRDGHDYYVYHDPGAPPAFGTEDYRAGFQQVLEWSGELDPADGVMIDISPASRGNNTLGTNDGQGRDLNPITGQPYDQQLVPAGDYYRVLAEFWADGPDSETPPGHWFSVANYVVDHELHINQFGGQGSVLDALEYDVKMYLVLGGAMHDSAISAWGVKGWYDYIRPVSAIRHMCDLGQSSDPSGPSYNPDGIGLVPGKIEVVTAASIQPGGVHEHLAGDNNENVGKIAAYAWKGPDYIEDPDTTTAGTDWILCENWWPYQRPSFVTPPFAGYVSGHSTFSRAAAEVMTLVTGDEYFPGGMGTFDAPQNEFLVFEEGPSVDLQLQWATYRDASDETSISRIYGGIHPTADDIPGRLMGAEIGPDAFNHATRYFSGELGILPTIELVTDISGQVFQPGESVVLSAMAADSDEADLSADIVWTSSVDGILGSGSEITVASLSAGVHTITATVTDSNGQTTELVFEIAIGSQLPTIELIGPANDTLVTAGDEILFTATADDFEQGDISADIIWLSDIDGMFASSGSASVTSLSPGQHTVTALVQDAEGNEASASVLLTVYGILEDPGASVTLSSNPIEDGFIVESAENSDIGGVAIPFLSNGGALRVGDNNLNQQIKLITSFAIPQGTTVSSATLYLTRGGGVGASPLDLLGPCTVDVHSTGFSNDPRIHASDFEAAPTVANAGELIAPASGDVFVAEISAQGVAAIVDGQSAQFRVSCTIDDNNDGLENSIGFYSGESADPALQPQLVLSASGSGSNTAPSVVIVQPADEARVALGDPVMFDASAMDDQDGDLSSMIIWRSSIDGIIGEGSIFSVSSLSQGSHTITAEALDTEFVPGRATITVHVGVDLTPLFVDATVLSGLNSIPGAIGLAAGDYDNDGCVDLAVTPRNVTETVLLYKSNCDGTFTNVTTQANMVTSGGAGSGLAWGDFDNDGLLDLYVANQSNLNTRSELWHNQGDGTFIDVSDTLAIPGNTGAIGVVWNDFDGDNDLDIFVAGRYGDVPADSLYQNDSGNFFDVAPFMGIDGINTGSGPDRLTYMGAFADFDGDLTQDLWLSVDFGADVLYRNIDGMLVDDSDAAGISATSATHGMGIAVGDPNGDGCLDVLVTNNGSERSTDPAPSPLHANNCDGTFTDITASAGVLMRNLTEWGANFVDFDNDGDEDLSIVAGGISNEEYANVLYQNVATEAGELQFADVTGATGTSGMGNSRGSIWFDFDEDGDMDWLIANSNGVILLRNDGPTGNYFSVKLAGVVSNSYGVGARIEVTVGSKTMIRYLQAGSSFASAEELEAAFGIGEAESIDQIVVKWPSGIVDTLRGPISANSQLLIAEGDYQ